MTDPKKVLNLSAFLAQSRQALDLQSKATFWFGAILSLVEEHQHKLKHDDTSTSDKVELLRLMTGVVGAIAGFYQQERPPGVYKLFNFVGQLLELWNNCGEYLFVVVKVSYLNTLALYHLRVKQYPYAFQLFASIYDLYARKPVDCTNEVFLTALSNYLSFLRKAGKRVVSRRLELEQCLGDLFFKFFTKFLVLERETSYEAQYDTLVLLGGVWAGHSHLLGRFEKDLNAVISTFYQQNAKIKRRLPDNMVAYLVKERVRKSLVFRIAISPEELLFYAAQQQRGQRTIREQEKEQEQDPRPQGQLAKVEGMLTQTIEMLQEQKVASTRYSSLQPQPHRTTRGQTQNYATISSVTQSMLPNETIESATIKKVQPLARSVTRRKEAPKQGSKRVQRWGNAPRVVKFKIFSIFVDVYEDGILLSDYTNENKRYLEWSTVSQIVERLEGQFVFEEFLKVPVHDYFDFVRILAPYLTKNDKREICLLPRPVPLLVVNSLIQLYKQEGSYLKLALMNQYANDKFEGVADLFLEHFDQFFKHLSRNEYLRMLNDRITGTGTRVDPPQRDSVLHVDFLKRKRETTAVELGSLLPVNIVQAVVTERDSLYKCIFLLKNNVHLLVRLLSPPEEGHVTIQVESLDRFANEALYSEGKETQVKVSKTIKVERTTLTHYLPLFDQSWKEYQVQYSRLIVDCLKNFEGYVDSPNLGGLSFTFVVHASQVEMIEYGKYYSVVSAELLGSKGRVWALVIRFYDMAFLTYKVTVLMNPYEGFLKNLVEGSKEEQSQAMRNLLIGESVRETVRWLKQEGRLGSRLNLFEYLHSNGLI